MRRSAAEVLCDEAPARFADLERLGVRFDADRHGGLALGLEGGHPIRRVVHAGGSATGRRILRQLSADVVEQAAHRGAGGPPRARACSPPTAAAPASPPTTGGELHARATILATGGAAALWSRTTNPPGSFGSGLLLARAAGAELADLEFVQFHPTAVTASGREGFLVTEAIRGEGATLHDAAASASSTSSRRATRSPARSTSDARRGEPASTSTCVPSTRPLPERRAALREAGLDPARSRPRLAGRHYVMGGIASDLEGRSTVPGLYAIGEAPAPACTARTAGLELAQRVLRVRAPRRARRPRQAAAAAAPPPARGASRPRRAPRARRRGDAGLERDPERLRALLWTRTRSRAPWPPARSPGGDPRRPPRTDFPAPDPALDDRHGVSRRAREPRVDKWT